MYSILSGLSVFCHQWSMVWASKTPSSVIHAFTQSFRIAALVSGCARLAACNLGMRQNESRPARRLPAGAASLHEDVQRQQGADDEIRHVDHLADVQVDRHAADGVGLLLV